MSAEVASALEQRAHQLDAEADNAASDPAQLKAGREPHILRSIAHEFRTLALMVQGKDPAAEEATRRSQEAAGGADGLSVKRTDEHGNPLPPPPDAQPAMPQSGATAGQPGPSYPAPGLP